MMRQYFKGYSVGFYFVIAWEIGNDDDDDDDDDDDKV